jgi:hypothetical protein
MAVLDHTLHSGFGCTGCWSDFIVASVGAIAEREDLFVSVTSGLFWRCHCCVGRKGVARRGRWVACEVPCQDFADTPVHCNARGGLGNVL